MENINKQCLERILKRLTNLVCLLELEDIDKLDNLVNLSTSVSAQLLATQKYEDQVYEEEYEQDCDEEYEEEYN